ncbi:hypothetical protein [Streptomyces sp. NPDC059009]|uniref:hypothetical protein n=1 Tax=Streptomyces sp. NPDC059009 TaxID=3346694 RepID=UPI0036A12DA6
MTKRQTTQEQPVTLPTGFNHWLTDCQPYPGCGVCAANYRQCQEAIAAGDIVKATRHATEVRDHAGGMHETGPL